MLAQGEAQFYEPPPLYGSNSRCFPSSCNTVHGRKCGWHHSGTCKGRRQDCLVSDFQFFVGVLCESDQLPGHQTYQCFDSSGMQMTFSYPCLIGMLLCGMCVFATVLSYGVMELYCSLLLDYEIP